MAKLHIENIYTPSNEEWDLIWKECNFATYFHSRDWAEIWDIYTKGKMRPCPKLILFSDGKKALLPLSEQSSLRLLKSYISSPAGTFGGWIATEKLEAHHANLIIDYLSKGYTNLNLFMNPYDELVSKLSLPQVLKDETYAIDLSNGFDEAFKKWKKSQRGKVKRATKMGVSIRLAGTFEDWNEYYKVYKDSLRRWGKNASTNYGKELFEELYQRKSPNIKLWLAIYENKIVAGNIAFYSKKQVVGWHAAALEKYLKLRVVNLVIYKILEDACEKGYSWLDFGPCGGHESVRAFKKEFGTEEISFPIINIESRPKKILNKLHQFALNINKKF